MTNKEAEFKQRILCGNSAIVEDDFEHAPLRQTIREEIVRAAKIWFEECAKMSYPKVDKHGNWYGMYSATTDEKLEYFIAKVMEDEVEQ